MQKIRKIKSDIVKKNSNEDYCPECGDELSSSGYCSNCDITWDEADLEYNEIDNPEVTQHSNEDYSDLYGDEVMDMLRKKKSIRKGQNVWYRKWIWVVDKVYKDRFGNVVCDIYMPGDPDVTEEGIQLSELSKRKKIKTDDLGRNTYGEPEKFSIRKKSVETLDENYGDDLYSLREFVLNDESIMKEFQSENNNDKHWDREVLDNWIRENEEWINEEKKGSEYRDFKRMSIRKKSNFPKCPECGSSTSYGGDIGYICSNPDCDNIFKKPKKEKETKKESMKKISINKKDVIQMFLEDSYPHSKEEAKQMGIRNFKTSYGTENLKITQMNGDKWALVNYDTPIVINDNGTFIFNTRKYSQTTSKIQNMIEGRADSLGINLVKKEGSGYGMGALGMKSIRKIKLDLKKSKDNWKRVEPKPEKLKNTYDPNNIEHYKKRLKEEKEEKEKTDKYWDDWVKTYD